MHIKTIIAAALGSAGFAAPAFAQDHAGDPASFTGPRAEIVGGWDHSNVPGGDMADGAIYGAAIGYDLQRGTAVFGIEGEITGSTLKDEQTLAPSTSFKGTLDRDLYVGARVGVVASPNLLLYAKAGYTNQRANIEYRSPTVNQDSSAIDGGYRLGAGAELKLAGKAYLKGEYRFSDYGGGERHQVLGGLGIRF